MAEEAEYFENPRHIMFTMGDDFMYMDARQNYKNMDKLIFHMNSRTAETGVHVLYSTPMCFMKALNKDSVQDVWTVKTDDFFPYASGESLEINWWI